MINISEMSFKAFSFNGEKEPSQKIALAFTSNNGSIQHGVWDCGPGELELKFSWHETVYVLEGKAVVKNMDTDEVILLLPGVLATFEKGTRWRWNIPWKFKKVFTIID